MTEIKNSKLRLILGFIVIWGITFAAAAVGGWASTNAPGFYAFLNKPSWAPPAAVFGPVWTLLYLFMAVAAWLVWREGRGRDTRPALSVYLVQLVMNAFWTYIFFTWRQGGWALAEIITLWVMIFLTIIAFYRIRPLSGFLLLPYLAWVSFAAGLNAELWRMNPWLL